jgi:hypothetical protein
MPFLARQRQAIDVSLGGVRIFSDEPMRVGELLKMEFFLKDAKPITYTAEVVWIEPLPAAAPARFDVGLKFLQLEPAALSVLVSVLGPLEDGEGEDGEASQTSPTGPREGEREQDSRAELGGRGK